MKEKIMASLDKIRKYLQQDGGDVEFVSEADGVVKVKLTGACGGCPMASMTLKNLVEQTIRTEIPEIKSVESV